MQESRWDKIKAIFHAASAVPAEEQAALLDQQCGGDDELRREVESLLRANSVRESIASAEEPAAPRPEGMAGTEESTIRRTPIGTPGEVIGRYRLLEQIGEGGFGEVWVAEQKSPVRRKVALKIVKQGMDTREVLARFEAERQALAMMDHPCIARVFDAGATPGGRPYFVMEHVAGVAVNDYCDTSRLRIKDRLKLFMDICQAVQHAHQKGIIHRDLKPSNILVTLNDGKPVPKVIDFGIAKATIGRLTERTLYTETGRLIGTPEYMSPEQAGTTGLDVDTRADIYSLGVILYQLLTGTLPFDAKTLRGAGFDGIARIIREQEPPKPSTRLSTMVAEPVNRRDGAMPDTLARSHGVDIHTLTRELRGDLDWITLKALEKDRSRRYESASALAADVMRHLTGEPVVAAPPSVGYRVKKFVRRYKGQVAAAGVIAAVLMGATVVSVAAWRHAEKGWQQAEAEKQRADEKAAEAELEAYVANIGAAQQALAAYNWPEARAKLQLCPPHLREWEWHLLQQKTGSILYSIPEVDFIRFNHASTRILVASGRWVRIYDASNGNPLGQPLLHESDIVFAHFDGDSDTILTGTHNDIVRRFDSHGSLVDQTESTRFRFQDSAENYVLAFHKSDVGFQLLDLKLQPIGCYIGDSVGSADVSRNRSHVAVICDDTVRLCSGNDHAPMLLQHTAHVDSVQFSPTNEHVLTLSYLDGAKIWDLKGNLLTTLCENVESYSNDLSISERRFIEAGNGDVTHVQFSPDGKTVLTLHGNGMARLWTLNGEEVMPPLMHDSIEAAAFSPDGTLLATLSSDNQVSLWSRSGCLLGNIMLPSLGVGVQRLRFSSDGTKIIAEIDGDIFMIDGHNLDWPEKRLIREHASLEVDVLLSNELLSGPGMLQDSYSVPYAATQLGSSRRAEIIDERSVGIFNSKRVHLVTLRLDRIVTGLQSTKDGSQLVARLVDGSAFVWDIRGREARQFELASRDNNREAASAFVKSLLASEAVPIDQLSSRIFNDSSIDADLRLARLEVLKREIACIMEQAREAFEKLVRCYVAPSRIRQAIERAHNDGQYSARVLEVLAKNLDTFSADYFKLNLAAFNVVRRSDEAPDRIDAALEAVQAATALQPNNADVLSTLGVALFRDGQYADAVKMLELSERQFFVTNSQFEPQPRVPQKPINWAVIAMARAKLGQKDESHLALETCRMLMRDAALATGVDNQVFLREAEALVEAPGWAAGPPKQATSRPATRGQ